MESIYLIGEKGKRRMVKRYVLAEDFKCKYCGSTNLWLYGKYKGSQRFYCRDCKRKFAGNSALPKMKSPVTHVSDAIHSYYSGMSLNEIRYNLEQQYNYKPSASTIFRWVNRFTREAKEKIKDNPPQVGDIWIADETVIKINKKNYWVFDIIDSESRYLLATHMSANRGTAQARALMEKAEATANKTPKVVITDKLRAYLDGIELAFGADTKHKQGGPFNVENNTNLIERLQGTIKDRTKVLRGLKSPETARNFLEGWQIHYNYFRPHISLDGKTPARKAGINLSVNDWLDVVREPRDTARIEVSKEPRQVLRLHHPPFPTITPKVPRITSQGKIRITPRHKPLGRNEVYTRDGMYSRRYFKGAKRQRLY